MRASLKEQNTSRPGTWSIADAEVLTAAAVCTYAPSSLNTASYTNNSANAFAACCRALSHKANTALVEQLPVLQNGTVVDLTRNYVGAAGLQAIAVVLPFNPNVTELRAPRNGLTNDAVVVFCRAMREHRRLAVLDFSCNSDLSLAGGLALLSLAQQVPSLQEIRLDGTHVPPGVLNKLKRALEGNATRSATPKKMTSTTGLSVNLKASSPTTTTAKNKLTRGSRIAEEEGAAQESAVLSALESRVRATVKDGYRFPPAVPLTGWRVLEVPILAPPFLFDTEVELLCTEVFPQLNQEFVSHKILLYPVLVMGSTGARDSSMELRTNGTTSSSGKGRQLRQQVPRTIGSYARELHFLPLCDVTAAVARGRFAAIELIGDRPGDYAQVSAAAMVELQQRSSASAAAVFDAQQQQKEQQLTKVQGATSGADGEKEGAAGSAHVRGMLQPVLYAAHEAALRNTQWLLVATRRETCALQVPAAFAPLLTADPSVAHPDRHRSVMRDIVYDDALATTGAEVPRGGNAAGQGGLNGETRTFARTLEWDYAAEEYQWKRHVAWRRHVVASAPVQELVLSQYRASFDRIDAAGALRLKDLEAFKAGIYNRLHTIVRACLEELRPALDESETFAVEKGAVSAPLTYDVHRILRRISVMKVWGSNFIQSVAALSSGAIKKNVMNRIVLYAANPPSRNSLLVHGHDVIGLAMFMCRAASRLFSLQHAYTLAFYSARSSALLEEPTDVRSFVVHVTAQLTTDAAVLRYVHAEVDAERLCAFCQQLLSGTVRTLQTKNAAACAAAGGGGRNSNTNCAAASTISLITAAGLPEYVAQYVLGFKARGEDTEKIKSSRAASAAAKSTIAASESDDAAGGTHAFVVLVDGIEKLLAPVRPCGALVHTTNVDGDSGVAGNRAEPVCWSDEGTSAGTMTAGSPFSKSGSADPNVLSALLPRALARNVRVIAGCSTDSSAFNVLRHLGRDSVETLSLGQVSANEVEQYLAPTILSRIGLTFSEDDFECARAKKDAALGEYMRYLQDAARGAQEAPGFLSQSQVIQAFPQTTTDAAQGVYDRLVCALGLPLTRNVLGFLTASRWGLTIPELRTLLPQLSACRLQELLRLLRPVLEPETPQEASVIMGGTSGNAQLGTVRIVVQSFLDVAHHEALQAVTDERQIDNDQRVWHTQLAQYYLSIVYRCLNSRSAERNGVRLNADEVNAVTTTLPPRSSPEVLAEQRRAMKEVIYHMTRSGAFWPQLDATILSLPFLQRVYEMGLGYAYLRDLTAAFNERYQRHLLGEDIGEASWQHTQQQQLQHQPNSTTSYAAANIAAAANVVASQYALPVVLARMRDYVRFAHDHGLLLSLRPALVAQMALQIPASFLNSVQRDAVTYLYRQLLQQQHSSQQTDSISCRSSMHHALYFTFLTNSGAAAAAAPSGKSAATHLGPVTCAAYLPNRKLIVTASRDRSLAWVNPQSGTVIWHARQPTAPVQSLIMCRTSAYVAAVSEDRTVWIYDGLQGKLVTQSRGNEWFDAPIAAVNFSARGRYVWVVTTDTRAHCFECETGKLRSTLDVGELLGRPKRRASATGSDINAPVVSRADDNKDGENHPRDNEEDCEEYAEVVQHSASEWRRRRNYLSVLPDRDEDEVFTTVVAHEVRQWHLYPWKTATIAGADSAAVFSDRMEKARDTLVAVEMTARCRLLPTDAMRKTNSASKRPEGYKWMVPWETSAAPQQQHGSRHSVFAFALPLTCTSEVHLFALPMETLNGKVAAAAVRCVFAVSSAVDSDDEDEVTVTRASPDGRWLVMGMKSGKIGLFDIRAAYCTWAEHQQQQQPLSANHASDAALSAASVAATMVCKPARVYTSLMPALGMVSTPISDLAFHRNGELLFGLGRSLQCWRVPPGDASETAEEPVEREVGEYVWAQAPTCLTVLPPPVSPTSDAELPLSIAEVCVGDETGRLTLLELWKPNY